MRYLFFLNDHSTVIGNRIATCRSLLNDDILELTARREEAQGLLNQLRMQSSSLLNNIQNQVDSVNRLEQQINPVRIRGQEQARSAQEADAKAIEAINKLPCNRQEMMQKKDEIKQLMLNQPEVKQAINTRVNDQISNLNSQKAAATNALVRLRQESEQLTARINNVQRIERSLFIANHLLSSTQQNLFNQQPRDNYLLIKAAYKIASGELENYPNIDIENHWFYFNARNRLRANSFQISGYSNVVMADTYPLKFGIDNSSLAILSTLGLLILYINKGMSRYFAAPFLIIAVCGLINNVQRTRNELNTASNRLDQLASGCLSIVRDGTARFHEQINSGLITTEQAMNNANNLAERGVLEFRRGADNLSDSVAVQIGQIRRSIDGFLNSFPCCIL